MALSHLISLYTIVSLSLLADERGSLACFCRPACSNVIMYVLRAFIDLWSLSISSVSLVISTVVIPILFKRRRSRKEDAATTTASKKKNSTLSHLRLRFEIFVHLDFNHHLSSFISSLFYFFLHFNLYLFYLYLIYISNLTSSFLHPASSHRLRFRLRSLSISISILSYFLFHLHHLIFRDWMSKSHLTSHLHLDFNHIYISSSHLTSHLHLQILISFIFYISHLH